MQMPLHLLVVVVAVLATVIIMVMLLQEVLVVADGQLTQVQVVLGQPETRLQQHLVKVILVAMAQLAAGLEGAAAVAVRVEMER